MCALAVLLGATLLVDRLVPFRSAGAQASPALAAVSAVPPQSAVSSSWYCQAALGAAPPPGTPGKPAPPAGPLGHASLVLANPTARDVRGTVHLEVPGGQEHDVGVDVPAEGRAVVEETSVVGSAAADVAATVLLEGGGVAAEQEIAGPLGRALVPCSSRASRTWYFGAGSTAGGSRLLIALYDPLPTSAIVNVSFLTPGGPLVPYDYQGMVVPAGGQVVLDAGTHAQDSALLAAVVTCSLGTVVAEQTSILPGSAPARLDLVGGVPAPARAWRFPAGLVAPGVGEEIDLADPGGSPAQVTLEIGASGLAVAPIEVSVPPGSVVPVPLAKQPRVPSSTVFDMTVRAASGAPVVATRSILDAPPASLAGSSLVAGGSGARRWVLAAGGEGGPSNEALVVQSTASRATAVTVEALEGGQHPGRAGTTPGSASTGAGSTAPGMPSLPVVAHAVVGAGQTVQLQVAVPGPGAPPALLVIAAAPVVVERDIAFGGGGVSNCLGEPWP